MEWGEYNPWDDRTTPDEHICAIIQGICYDKDCDHCDAYIAYNEYFETLAEEGR